MILSSTPFRFSRFLQFIVFIIIAMGFLRIVPQLDWIADLQNPKATLVVGIFQFVSDSISFISFGAPLIIALIGEFKPQPRKTRISLLYILLSIGVAGLLSYLIKKGMPMPRPYEIDSRILQLSGGGGNTFPSGHTTEAFASASAISFAFRSRWITWIMITWAITVGISRIYLGVHYPFDVLGGILLGTSVSFILYTLFKSKVSYFGPADRSTNNYF